MFRLHTIDQHANLYANFLPNDRLWSGKRINLTPLRNWLLANANQLQILESKIVEFINEHNPATTKLFLEEWEAALGIPDDCIPKGSSDDERRAFIMLKLTGLSAQTRPDFLRLANILGYQVRIYSLGESAYPPYNVPFIPCGFPVGRFVWVVSGVNLVPGVPPYNVPFTPQANNGNILIRLFNKLKPAFTRLIFVNE